MGQILPDCQAEVRRNANQTETTVMETKGAEAPGDKEMGKGEEKVTPEPHEMSPLLHEQPSRESAIGTNSSSMTTAPATGSAVTPRKILKGKPKPLYFWSAADVNKWWRKHGGLCYQLYGDLLTEHDVGGRTLIRMNEIKLEKIGITNVEHRHELMQHILRLRLKHDLTELRTLEQRGVGFELKLPEPRPATQPTDKTEKTDKSITEKNGRGAALR
ncbi:uncharacterized protein LOC112573125 isoform X2 [Pomacea canaliculata]|uniref:uncharacterized protein LOC112573125 isoform X2 n=1 Tax=Pomacea canaliculata TaxID=400727 RepID=UPI000D72CF43|nr:uncharacterized protein LOC112573125 isoform X2 [Pomacea canaliculata]